MNETSERTAWARFSRGQTRVNYKFRSSSGTALWFVLARARGMAPRGCRAEYRWLKFSLNKRLIPARRPRPRDWIVCALPLDLNSPRDNAHRAARSLTLKPRNFDSKRQTRKAQPQAQAPHSVCAVCTATAHRRGGFGFGFEFDNEHNIQYNFLKMRSCPRCAKL